MFKNTSCPKCKSTNYSIIVKPSGGKVEKPYRCCDCKHRGSWKEFQELNKKCQHLEEQWEKESENVSVSIGFKCKLRNKMDQDLRS
jgi:NMD protein affecting ribosome stability and mRNA decay